VSEGGRDLRHFGRDVGPVATAGGSVDGGADKNGGDGTGGRAGAGTAGRSWGLLAEFAGVPDLMTAVEECRRAGFRHWDVHTPFPVHGMNNAMGIRNTRLPLVVLGGGLTGMGLALLMQWWMNAVDYKLIVSGKPFFSVPANIPVTFELTILFSALSVFVGMLAMNALPRHHHPLFTSERFRRATQDRFFISIESKDPRYDETRVRGFLEALGSVQVERIVDEED
jgi:hypothetical protein